jgi:choline dehydrogenase-like flavoprotein
LKVRGAKGLRVADASIMPTLHGGHTRELTLLKFTQDLRHMLT